MMSPELACRALDGVASGDRVESGVGVGAGTSASSPEEALDKTQEQLSRPASWEGRLASSGGHGGVARLVREDEPAGPLRLGQVLLGTPFVVVRLVGEGGMGEVYEVEHGALGKRCAVKVLHRRHRDRSDLAVRMREEARALASLHHPALVDVFDLGVTSDGRPYFAMELLVGRDLRRELSRFGVIAVPAALRLMAEALGGLEAAHRAGIVHRDIKLENLFLCDSGSLKVLDFGIAKVLGSGGSLTDHGSVVGTARSMAPEQHEGGPVDGRTDVYAAGLALYELVAGRGPFDELRTNARAMRLAHCERSPLPPSRLAAQPIPHAVDEAILRSLAKRPADRFQSAGEMADVLRSLTGGRRSGPSRRGEGLLLPAAASRARSRGELRGLLTSGAAAVGSAIGRIFPLRS